MPSGLSAGLFPSVSIPCRVVTSSGVYLLSANVYIWRFGSICRCTYSSKTGRKAASHSMRCLSSAILGSEAFEDTSAADSVGCKGCVGAIVFVVMRVAPLVVHTFYIDILVHVGITRSHGLRPHAHTSYRPAWAGAGSDANSHAAASPARGAPSTGVDAPHSARA